MGKPIAGQNQFPYTIGGFLVDGAKINGVTYAKKLYIHKQRSYDLYDLMDTDGNIFKFIRIVGNDVNGKRLNYFTVSEELVETIPNNTFFLKIQDAARNIFSFVRIYQWHKCITVDGDYVFRTADIDPYLGGVLINPIKSTLAKNNTLSYKALFFPNNYEDVDGDWFVNDVNGNSTTDIQIVSSDKNTAVVKGDVLGTSVLVFVPKSNNTLVTHAMINVIDEEKPVEFFELVLTEEYSSYAFDQNYTIEVVTYPYDAVIDEPLNVQINDEDYTRTTTRLVSVSPDNKKYTFSTVKNSDTSSDYANPTFIFNMTSPIEYSVAFYDVMVLSWTELSYQYADPGKLFNIPYASLPNMTHQLTSTIQGPNTKLYPIESSDPSIATLDYQTGILTTYGNLGTVEFKSHYENVMTGLESDELVHVGRITVREDVYERIESVPTNVFAMAPGTSQNFHFLGYRTGYDEPTVIECRPYVKSGTVTVTPEVVTVDPNAVQNNRFTILPVDITPDYQIMANYNSASPYIIIRDDPEEIVPLTHIDIGGIYGNAMMIKLEDAYDKFNTPMMFMYPRPYYSPQYLLEPLTYDSSVIELVEPDVAFGRNAYYGAGSVILRIKGLKRGSTELVVGSKSFPEIQTSFKIIVY